MAMKKIPLDELKPGMVFDKAVYIDMNNILAAPMVPIKKEDIERLKKWGIEEVETAGEIIREGGVQKERKGSLKGEIERLQRLVEGAYGEERESTAHEKDFLTLFNETLALLKDIYERVRNGVGYKRSEIFSKVEELKEEIKKDKYRAITIAIQEHDERYLYVLGVSVAVLSIVTGLSLNLSDEKLHILGVGALLHDIGMVRIPAYIVEKKGKLTSDEYSRIKTHTIYGYRIILKELGLENEIATIALQHHENYDGSGYPRKLKGNAISPYARIVSICDAYVAMTRKRSYRDELMFYNAMKAVVSAAHRKFDPALVKIFLSNMAIYPVGSYVELNNGMFGKVVRANPDLPLRPTISVLVDQFGDKVKEGEKLIVLQNERDLFIKRSLTRDEVTKLLYE